MLNAKLDEDISHGTHATESHGVNLKGVFMNSVGTVCSASESATINV